MLGQVQSAALTNEYERERATLASVEVALTLQTIEVRRQILKSSQDSDLAKVQITAAEREYKRAQDAWDIHVIPERDFKGYVESVAAGTGSVFSLFPPDNATGNFVRVVQRLPVRIRFSGDWTTRVRPGISASVTIDTTRLVRSSEQQW